MTHRLFGTLLAAWLLLTDPKRRDERGGSNTVEVLLYIGLAIAVAAIVTFAVKGWVASHLP